MRLIVRRDASDRLAAMDASVFPKLPAHHRREMQQEYLRRARAGFVKQNAMDRVPPERRVLMIGQAIKLKGEQWKASHPERVEWLRSQGISDAEAIRRYDAWNDAEMSNSFWE